MTHQDPAFTAKGRFWRGNLHTHSTRSDGVLSPEEVCRRYKAEGYDFMALTDHFVGAYGYPIVDTVPMRDAGFTTILGAELHSGAMANGELWHILAVGLHHGHRQARDANVEDGHGRGVDDAQPHPLAGPEQAGPVLLRPMAVDQIGVGRSADVEDVARVHPHLAPHAPFLQAHAVLAGEEARQGRALPVEVAGALLQLVEDFVRMHEAPVGEHDYMFTVIGDRIGRGGIDGAMDDFLANGMKGHDGFVGPVRGERGRAG